jgi:rod shape determining protein RodA
MPLPFVSYGGSNLITNMICIGLLENIYMRRHKIVF